MCGIRYIHKVNIVYGLLPNDTLKMITSECQKTRKNSQLVVYISNSIFRININKNTVQTYIFIGCNIVLFCVFIHS